MELYDDPKNGKGTDTLILGVDSSSLEGKMMSPTAEPKGKNWLSGKPVTVVDSIMEDNAITNWKCMVGSRFL